MLVVLETLSPDERAVFVLREVFGFSHDDVISLRRRQIRWRCARWHTVPASTSKARRRRFDPRDARQSGADHHRVPERRDHRRSEGLMSMPGSDVVFTADSDGKVSCAASGAGRGEVARLVIGLMTRAGAEYRPELTTCNGAPAMIAYRRPARQRVHHRVVRRPHQPLLRDPQPREAGGGNGRPADQPVGQACPDADRAAGEPGLRRRPAPSRRRRTAGGSAAAGRTRR